MKMTMPVSLDKIRSLTDDDDIIEVDGHFQTALNGGGSTLLLTFPKELPIRKPGEPRDPLGFIADVYGFLPTEFGRGYESTIMYVVGGTLASAAANQPATVNRRRHLLSDQPEQFNIDVSQPIADSSYALVTVEYPLDNPPPEARSDDERWRRLGALYYCRVDHNHPDADFSVAHGSEIWILPTRSLGSGFLQWSRQRFSDERALAEMLVRSYYMDAPCFRERIRESLRGLDKKNKWQIEYGDDLAELTIFTGSDNEYCKDIYYNLDGLKLIDRIVKASQLVDSITTASQFANILGDLGAIGVIGNLGAIGSMFSS